MQISASGSHPRSPLSSLTAPTQQPFFRNASWFFLSKRSQRLRSGWPSGRCLVEDRPRTGPACYDHRQKSCVAVRIRVPEPRAGTLCLLFQQSGRERSFENNAANSSPFFPPEGLYSPARADDLAGAICLRDGTSHNRNQSTDYLTHPNTNPKQRQ